MKKNDSLFWHQLLGKITMIRLINCTLKAVIIFCFSIYYSSALLAGGATGSSTTGGGTLSLTWGDASSGSLTNFADMLQDKKYQVYLVDDSAFINMLGLINDSDNDFSNQLDIYLEGLVVNKGITMVTGFRNTDANDVFFISKSQYNDFGMESYSKLLEDVIKSESSFTTFKP